MASDSAKPGHTATPIASVSTGDQVADTRIISMPWQKRGIDLGFSVLAIAITSPFLLCAVASILFETIVIRRKRWCGAIYSEERVSRGSLFRIYKFNVFDPEILGPLIDSRVAINTKVLEQNGHLTKVGRLLVRTYLDELPQLFNILRGEMSLVGPRPINVDEFVKKHIHGTPAIAVLTGGLTGNFQSYKDTHASSLEALQSLEGEYLACHRPGRGLDLLRLDLRILLRTVRVFLRAKGA